MKLYGTTTSPYARIARVVVFEKHLQNNIEFIWIKTRIPNDPFLSINPSGRVPFLLLSDGLGLEDTPAIVDYLDALQKPYLFYIQWIEKLGIQTLRIHRQSYARRISCLGARGKAPKRRAIPHNY